MPGKVFVNYRRDDERSTAARIRDRLAATFGEANVFMDVDNLLAGQRFDKELEKALDQTDVFLAVIGPRWLELLARRQASGERDYVREEITGALQRGIVVIPLLIERTPLPRADALPEEIRDLVLHQKHIVTHEQFGRDVAGLVEAIRLVWAKEDREHAKVYRENGNAYVDRGDYDRAIADLTKAIKIDPKDPIACLKRGDAYFRKGDYDRAIADFTKAININPEDATAYNHRGHTYFQKGDYNRAMADFTTRTLSPTAIGALPTFRGMTTTEQSPTSRRPLRSTPSTRSPTTIVARSTRPRGTARKQSRTIVKRSRYGRTTKVAERA